MRYWKTRWARVKCVGHVRGSATIGEFTGRPCVYRVVEVEFIEGQGQPSPSGIGTRSRWRRSTSRSLSVRVASRPAGSLAHDARSTFHSPQMCPQCWTMAVLTLRWSHLHTSMRQAVDPTSWYASSGGRCGAPKTSGGGVLHATKISASQARDTLECRSCSRLSLELRHHRRLRQPTPSARSDHQRSSLPSENGTFRSGTRVAVRRRAGTRPRSGERDNPKRP
jgi:hypothetical protein